MGKSAQVLEVEGSTFANRNFNEENRDGKKSDKLLLITARVCGIYVRHVGDSPWQVPKLEEERWK